MVKKLFPDPFLEYENCSYPSINSLKFYTVHFCCMDGWALSKDLKTKLQTTFFYLMLSILKKTSRGPELVSLLHFLRNIWKNIFFLLYTINWRSFIVCFFLLREILGRMCIVLVCWPDCDVMKFEVNIIFLVKPFFQQSQKVVTKT